uniref:AC9 transposase n=1 Tax=Cajanus cajan TaxID=3821 RepID=A0A151SM19_CAJCA|nr:Putative AC9 transposase [Cajanus cajan]
MRCCEHILNLIVKEGFKDNIHAILRIRGAVKYIQSSPSKLSKFKTCVKQQNIEYKGLVCLDVETKRNSTYLMLEAALKLRKTFEELEMQDKKYIQELRKVKGVPSYANWEFVHVILPFLKMVEEMKKKLTHKKLNSMKEVMMTLMVITIFFQRTSSNKSKLSKYLEETLKESYGDLDILSWWKLNLGRFPILAKMARDLLAVHVSTVASETAFSIGGRVLDPYRSSLTPRMAKTLICTQDWLKGTQLPLFSNENEDFEKLKKFEQSNKLDFILYCIIVLYTYYNLINN